MSRQAKIDKLKKTKARKAPETLGDYAILADAMEAIVADFKQSLKKGVDINDLDVLIDRLDGIGELKASVDTLKEAMANFPAIPEEVKIASVNEFLDAIKEINITAPDVNVSTPELNIPDYSKSVIKLAGAVEGMAISIKAIAPKPQSQRAADYIPYRRVIKKGNTFEFDDSVQQGGPGGSTTPSRKNASGEVYVPVANPDGTEIGGSGGDASAANQLLGNASLDNIETYLRNRFGGGKTSVPFTVTASGNTTIHTPAAGKAVRLFSIDAITDPDELTTPLIKVLIGSTEKLRGHAIGKWEIFEGAADEVLKINLSALSSVSGVAILEEFTP